MLAVPMGMWGQSSGLYYIANNNDKSPNYNSSTPTTNYYLVPASNGGDGSIAINRWAWNDDAATPFVTTYQTNKDNNSIWIIKESETAGEYYLIHLFTGKYMTLNAGIGSNSNRRTFHMEVPSPLGDNHLFNFTTHSGTPNYYSIKPKTLSSGHRFLNPSKANQPTYYGSGTQESGYYIGGLIGTFNKDAANDAGSKWFLETAPVLTAPSISDVSLSNTITITDANSLPVGYTIRYTTDGTDPDATTGTVYSTPINVISSMTVKAVVVRYELVLTEVATKAVTPILAAPTIDNVGGTITLSTTTPGAKIYYTTDGTTPSSSNGTLYSAPFSIGEATVIKAIAYSSDLSESSDVVTYEVHYAAPTITFNNATGKATITCEGATNIYYTIDGSTPTTSSNTYSTALDISSPTTIKAIAEHAGYHISDVTTLVITQVATPTVVDNGDNTISLACATDGATLYYTTDGTTPTTGSTAYDGAPLDQTDGVSGKTIKVLAVKADMINSAVGSGSVTFTCAAPVFTRTDNSFTLACSYPSSGVTIHYTIGQNGATPSDPDGGSTAYSSSVDISAMTFPVTVKAIAMATDYTSSAVVTHVFNSDLTGDGTSGNPYVIATADDYELFVAKANSDGSKCFKLTASITVNGSSSVTTAFTGTFTAQADGNGNYPVISGLTHPIFTTATGATISNIMLKDIAISQPGYVGAICGTANGATRIYNCGILPTTADASANSGVGSTDSYCGGLVGYLDGTARVINCFSFATITGGTNVGGIVGYNNVATTAATIATGTMVMNCMFYGDITGGSTVSPVYGGQNINNLNSGGLNTFNYYAYDKLKTASIGSYNCALAADEKYLTRFEFYRLLLNSNKKLAAYYVTGNKDDANLMLKWVLDKNIAPYPILKQQGTYPSIVNYNTTDLDDYDEAHRNQGRKTGTLAVTISESNTTGGGQTKPTDATVTTTSLTLVRTDKDTANFNFNYDKVQLPYYNDVGSKNYTENKVVTGWKITSITTLADDPYTSSNYDYSKTHADNPEYFDYPNYNFADRKSSQKDLYSVSGRVFSQGAYFDVPYGVTSITIEPYWGMAAYVSDQYLDVVYNTSYSAQSVTQLGNVYGSNGTNVTINGSSQPVYTSISNALSNLSGVGSPTVYDYAVVLVGNLHQSGVPSGGDKPFTMMSVDLDNDHEPDYSMIYHHNTRATLCPLRFDFLNIPGTAHAQKPYNTSTILNAAIFRTKGWFEITNTAFIYFTQYEYENTGTSDKPTMITKTQAPLILLGGYIDQFVSAQSAPLLGKTIYIHVGGNVLINSFGLGTHSDGSGVTQHVPVSVTGGEYNEFYLSGTYNQDATPCDDNAECYISGGRFGELAGAAQEQIGSTSNGNVTWQIYNADITDFYGGGVNDAKPVQGSITTNIYNSHVTTFCGGPKFGNMASGKTVTTTAEGCTFDKYFGAGFGGNSYSKKKYFDNNADINWSTTLQNYYITDRGKYFDGTTTNSRYGGSGNDQYGKKGPGVATDFDYEQFIWTSGTTGGRFFVKFVSFSLAQCNNVTSDLTNCTIKQNFYGGGSLGTVAGNATSTLTDCTVHGDVFGAGYSATLPTIEVRDAGFASDGGSGYLVPTINTYSGMFEAGVLSGTTTFEWKNATEAGVTLTNGESGSELTNHYVYTNQDLTSLGTVTGNVTLTIDGTSMVWGNVFGGGEESAVTGNTEVLIKGKTKVYNNVYGGGNQGEVGGNTKVIVNGAIVTP